MTGSLLVAVGAASFGLSHVAGPLTYGAEGNNVFTLLFLNNLFALPVMALAMKLKGISFQCKREAVLPLVALGVLGTAGTSLCLNASFLFAGVGIGTMLHMSYLVVVELTDAFLQRQRVRAITWVTLVFICLGVFFLASSDMGGTSVSAFGIFLALLSGFLYALYWLGVSHTAAREEDPIRVQFYASLCAAAVFLGYTLLTRQLAVARLTPKAWLLNLVCSLSSSVFGFLLTQLGIRRIGAAEAAILGSLEPLTSVVLGCLLLREPLPFFKVLGCLCILTGIFIKPVIQLLAPRKHTT